MLKPYEECVRGLEEAEAYNKALEELLDDGTLTHEQLSKKKKDTWLPDNIEVIGCSEWMRVAEPDLKFMAEARTALPYWLDRCMIQELQIKELEAKLTIAEDTLQDLYRPDQKV
jgi:hypothetical protein